MELFIDQLMFITWILSTFIMGMIGVCVWALAHPDKVGLSKRTDGVG